MLPPIRAPTRITNQPGLKPSIKRATRCRIAAAIRHDATNHHSRDIPSPKELLQLGGCRDRARRGHDAQEGVVGILCNNRWSLPFLAILPRRGVGVGVNEFLDRRHELPVVAALDDRAVGAPFTDQLVRERGREFCFAVAVLREDTGPAFGGEKGVQVLDFGEGGFGHGGEDVLHVDY